MDSPRRITIVHLNDDCLESILLELNLIDLAKAAHANICLARIGKNVFKRKYHQQEIHLNIKSAVSFTRDGTSYYDAALVIKHFGKYITKLNISGDIAPEFIEREVTKRCSDTLLELKLGNFYRAPELSKPFTKLEKLAFYRCFSQGGGGKPLGQFSTLFPNLRSFELQNIRYAFEIFALEEHMPLVQHFGYYTFPYVTEISAENLETIGRIIALNPQIRSFSTQLGSDYPEIEGIPALPLLGIETFEACRSFNVSDVPSGLPNLKDLRLLGSSKTNEGWYKLAPQIQKLELTIDEVDEGIVDFISKCQNLSTLKIITTVFDQKYVGQIVKNTQSLDEVHIAVYSKAFTSGDNKTKKIQQSQVLATAIKFMNHCKQLKKATVAFNVDKTPDSRSKYKLNAYTKSHQVIKSFKDTIKQRMRSWYKWHLTHQLNDVELVKGFEGYGHYLSFDISFERSI